MPTVVIGTAGHIDHGKTSLLRALTGIDADRLPEEQARGMTIDVGYAHMAYDDGIEIDFVDVPGHDRLIGNMLVGAGEIDAAMLVVAADDGPRPQTLEHLQLLDALDIADGLAVITKTDLVDVGRLAAVRRDVAALLAGTSLAGVPVIGASAASGDGVGALRAAIRIIRDRVAARLATAEAGAGGGPARLAIDRAFTAKGRGVVVTGTLRGSVASGAWLRREPGGELVRVRALQVHNQPRESHRGGRVAFNLTGDVAGELRRGDVLIGGEGGGVGGDEGGDGVLGVDRLLVRLRPPTRLGGMFERPVRARTGLRLHAGTVQIDATMRRIRAADGLAVLTLAAPLASFAGDRCVLREPASGAVVAAVRVLDLGPPRGISRRRLTPGRLVELSAAVDTGDPVRIDRARLDLHGALPAKVSTPGEVPSPVLRLADDVRAALVKAALAAVVAHHHQVPMSPGLSVLRARATLLKHLRSTVTVERQSAEVAGAAVARLLDDLVADGRLARSGDALRDPGVSSALPAELVASMDRLERALDVAAPPPLEAAAAAAGCPPDGIRVLTMDGRIVRLAPDLAWATPAYHRLAALALERARVAPLTPAAYRDATGTSRRFVLAILEDLDRRGVLVRTPEGHVPGPRAPQVGAPQPPVS